MSMPPLPGNAQTLMDRMGHSSTRAARVYLHAREERDRQLAATLDKMARRELRRSSGTRSGGQSGTQRDADAQRDHKGVLPIMAGRRPGLGTQHVERVTGIEPALSAWESVRSGPLTALSWAVDAPLVTVMDPVTPGLMAR